MGATPIEWTDFSVNPLRARLAGRVGHYCEKTSPGCKNCYSSRLQPRFGLPQFKEQRTADVEHFLDWKKLREVLMRRKPTKYFWCDMTDMFGEWVPDEQIALCFATMAATPWHTHQVLTKRAERMKRTVARLYENDGEMLIAAAEELAGYVNACHLGEDDFKFPLPNVWLGVSCEDQERADERLPVLLATPAAIRFVSAEPLLGPLDLRPYLHRGTHHVCPTCLFATNGADLTCPNDRTVLGTDIAIDWVIVGGESGNGARPCEVKWIRSIVEQCAASGAAVFVKQLGANAHATLEEIRAWEQARRLHQRLPGHETHQAVLAHSKGGDIEEFPHDLRVRQFPEAS